MDEARKLRRVVVKLDRSAKAKRKHGKPKYRKRKHRIQVLDAAATTLQLVADVLNSNDSNSEKVEVLDAAYRYAHDAPKGLTRHVALVILDYHIDRLCALDPCYAPA